MYRSGLYFIEPSLAHSIIILEVGRINRMLMTMLEIIAPYCIVRSIFNFS